MLFLKDLDMFYSELAISSSYFQQMEDLAATIQNSSMDEKEKYRRVIGYLRHRLVKTIRDCEQDLDESRNVNAYDDKSPLRTCLQRTDTTFEDWDTIEPIRTSEELMKPLRAIYNINLSGKNCRSHRQRSTTSGSKFPSSSTTSHRSTTSSSYFPSSSSSIRNPSTPTGNIQNTKAQLLETTRKLRMDRIRMQKKIDSARILQTYYRGFRGRLNLMLWLDGDDRDDYRSSALLGSGGGAGVGPRMIDA